MGEEMKKCPFCGEEIKASAIKCRYCKEMLNAAPASENAVDNSPENLESSSNDYTTIDKLSLTAKLAFVGVIVAMALVNCRDHSSWWLIGYGLVLLTAINLLTRVKLSEGQSIALIFGDIVLVVMTFLAFDSFSIGWPISQLVLSFLITGGLQNLFEEQSGEKSTSSNDNENDENDENDENVNNISEDDEVYVNMYRGDITAMMSQIILASRHGVETIKELLQQNRDDKKFEKAMEWLLKRGTEENDAEALYAVGIISLVDAISKDSEEEFLISFRLIAMAAKAKDYNAEIFIAKSYKRLHNEFAPQAEKQMLFKAFQETVNICDPEECYQRNSYKL